MADMSNLLGKISDPMTIIIRVIELMAECFWFLWEFLWFHYFLSIHLGFYVASRGGLKGVSN